jgi:subtilisin family serine protease
MRTIAGGTKESIRVIIRLKQKPPEAQFTQGSNRKGSRALKRRRFLDQVRQVGTLGFLDEKRNRLVTAQPKGKHRGWRRQAVKIAEPKPLWLANCVAATVRPEDLPEIAARPEVLDILENKVVSIPPMEVNDVPDPEGGLDMWNFSAIGLDRIAGLGLDGNGVRIGIIDTGMIADHPELAGKLAAWAEFGVFGEEIESDPHETHYAGHGTHVASVLAGDSTGIAPGATLIGALALPGGFGSTEQVLAAMEWVLDPDQDPQTDDGAQVVNMSWGAYGTSAAIRDAADSMIEMGVLPVGAIGNYGPGTSISPGNVPGTIGAGALDKMDDAAYFSGGGEACWEDVCVLKPDVSAPGVNIVGIGADGSYQVRSGTSFAAPHVAAAAALLLDYHPGLTLAQINAFVSNSARDLGPAGPDERYGQGGLDLQSAFDFLQRYESRLGANDLVLASVESAQDQEIHRFYSFFSDGTDSFTETIIAPEIQGEIGQTKVVGLGDVNGDGYADLVVERTHLLESEGQEVRYEVFPSMGAGGFSSQADTWHSLIAPEPLETIGLADVNGDGYADLVVVEKEPINASYFLSRVQVMLSDGKRRFDAWPEPWLSLSHSSYFDIGYGLGDTNGDGRGDLIISQRYRYFNTPITFYLAHSSGSSFQKNQFPSVTISSAFNGPLRHVACADVNADGLDDLILTAQVLPTATTVPVYVCLGTLTGMMRTEQRWADVPLQSGGSVATAADIDGDGAADLVVKTADVDPQLEIWLSDRLDGFVKTADAGIDSLDGLADTQITFEGAANIGLGNWQ